MDIHRGENTCIEWKAHFLATPGYVYAYAFGELLVLALYARYEQEGWAFVPAYLRLLAADPVRDRVEIG